MIYDIKRIFTPNGSLVRILTDSTIEEVIATGWLALQESDIERVNNGPFEWYPSDSVLLSIIVPPTDAVNPGYAAYTNIFTVFPDRRSLNPNAALIPNLQNIVAHAGGGQADATQLNIGINVVTVVATAGDSVKLPSDVLGQTVIISNRGANALALFPSSGDSIDQLPADTAIFIFPNETYILYGDSAQNWASVNISPVLISAQGITAHAGGGAANATKLNVGLSVITTVATAGDSVILPANSIGQMFAICNLGANSVDIYPPSGANFQGLGTDAALALAAGNWNFIVGGTATKMFYK